MQETRRNRRDNNAYAYEMSDADHEELAAALNASPCMIVLSGYRCELYDDAFRKWTRVDRETYADGANKRIESLWINPLAADHGQRQLSL